MGLLFDLRPQIITSPIYNHSKVAEPEKIRTNHLRFTKSLFQHYCQYLGLTNNHLSTESVFNFYINERISYLLGVLEKVKQSPLTWDASIKIYARSKQLTLTISQINLQAAITHTKDFESAELKANHAQTVNLVINGSSELNSKLKQFSNFINQKLEGYSYSSPSTNQQWQQETHVCHYCVSNSKISTQFRTISTELPTSNAAANLLTTHLSDSGTSYLSTAATNNILTSTNSNTATKLSSDDIRKFQIKDYSKLKIGVGCSSTNSQLIKPNSRTRYTQNSNFQYYLSLLVISEDATSNNLEAKQKQPLTNNIPPATITKNKSLTTIFPFELEELIETSLFSRAVLKSKPIMAMYTDTTVNSQSIKLILDSVDQAVSTRIITANKTIKTSIGKIDDFSFKVNDIIILIKVLVMKATQYQALKLELCPIKITGCKPTITANHVTKNDMTIQSNKAKTRLDEEMWNNISGQGRTLLPSIYTHCKQRFNIPDGIEIVEKTLYQYIENRINNYLLGNYNISKVRSNLYNNLVHYSRLRTEDLNSETLATYFQELNYNIIKYCEEKYPVQSKYFFDFKSETETSNKDKQKVKQHSKTAPNTLILPKTTAKHLQTLEQGTSIKLPLSITPFPILLPQPQTPNSTQEPILTSTNIIEYLQENESDHSENLESKETESKQGEATKNKEEMTTAYIAKIPEFTGKNNDTSSQEWLDKVQKAGDVNEEPFENWQAFKNAFLQQFTDNNTSITLCNCFCNIKQETFKTFIAELKDKLIKKVCPHVSVDLATAIRHVKSYEMAMEETNHTKLVNLAIGETSSAAEEKIDQLTKKVESYFTNQQQQQQQPQRYQCPQQCNQNNFGSPSNNQLQNCHYCGIPGHWKRDCRKLQRDQQNRSNQRYFSSQQSYYQPLPPTYYSPRPQNQNNYYQPAPQSMQQQYQQPLPIQQYQTQPTQQYQVPTRRLQRPNYFHTQPTAVPRTNPSNHTIPSAQIAQNANLLDIFPFEFEANELPFLLSNAVANKQKAITAIYTEATLQKTVDRPAQTVIVIADGMKKTPVGEINNFLFTIDGITIPVKVLVMDAPQYQVLVRNDWLLKTNANLDWETQELKILYQEQHTIVPVTCAPVFEFEEKKEMPLTETYMALESTSNWTEETEQEIFEESRGWKKVRYSTPEPWKQPPYILLKCKDCNKKLSSMRACIFPEKEYETRTCYFCKACHRERFGFPKRNMLPEEYNWIDVAMRGEVCDQTCQYALSISEKVRRGTLFNAAYNSAHNKLYYYPHDAEMIFDLAIALINGATQKDICQMKKAEYIEYTMELAGFNYEDKQINIQLCKECIMPCDNQWCLECYALSIPLSDKNDKNEIEFGVFELVKELPTTPIYFLEKQPPLQLKYFDNHSQGIRPEKAHEIDAGYDLRYSGKDTLVIQPKFLTKINLKIALEILPGAMVQIASRSLLVSKGINIRRGVIDAGYTRDITIMLQNETDKPFKIEHAKKIAQAIYLSLINISGLQSVNNREQLRGTQGFGSTERFTVPE
ncbi:hypothetical protein G9A89_004237 [Geosiphon pyriformis]|nr:hypothetical protein G9A89_004237 [Geosiphon pyriformis]